MDTTVLSRAKINLVLDVIGKRDDGYHEVDMVMQKIDLYDEVFLKKIDQGIVLETSSKYLPVDSRNIAYQAAQLMRERFNIESGIYIHIEKNIPIAAGLAGGSSNAAATIKGINDIFEIGLTLSEMMKIGKEIGADVPFCFLDGAARAQGVGEILTPVKGLENIWIVLTKPSISISTKDVYTNLRPSDYLEHPDVQGMIDALESGNVYEITEKLGNVLEKVAFRFSTSIEKDKKLMRSFGAKGVLMSGSGPSVYGLFSKKSSARAAYKNFKRINQQTYIIKSYNGVED